MPIHEVVDEPNTWYPQASGSSEPFLYLDISSIDAGEGRIVRVATIAPSEAPSRARQLVRSGDVLVSTVRPGLNAIAVVPDDLDGATATTGFAVLRPDTTKVEGRYLYYWLRSTSFIRDMTRRATGASYPAVTNRVVRESRLPLPSLPEQRRIAAVLDKADSIRRKRRESLQLVDDFLRSAFLELFGDPVRNEKGWEQVAADDLLADLRYGTSVKCFSERTASALPALRIPNVVGGEISWDNLKYAALEKAEVEKFGLKEGDILFVRTNGNPDYIGRCAVFDGSSPALFASYLIRGRIDPQAKYYPQFLKHVLSYPSFRTRVVAETRTTAGNYNISTKGVRRLRVIRPHLELQERFLAINEKAKRQRIAMVQTLRDAEALSGSLAQQAFGAAQ